MLGVVIALAMMACSGNDDDRDDNENGGGTVIIFEDKNFETFCSQNFDSNEDGIVSRSIKSQSLIFPEEIFQPSLKYDILPL